MKSTRMIQLSLQMMKIVYLWKQNGKN